jgi:phytoene dehydrogenase-like protein
MTADAVIVGSGHNSLVAAAYLARAGWDVVVLERNDVPGGAVATEELTLPGYRHDTFSCWHPLFHLSGAYAELGDELAARGLRYRDAELPTASVATDGRVVLGERDPGRTAAGFAGGDGATYLAELERFGEHAETIGELLGTEPRSPRAALLAGRLARALGPRGVARFAGEAMASARAWLDSRFEGSEPAMLLAPWVLHTGLSPDGAGGGFQLLAIAGAVHQVGMPVVEGGSGRFVDAFVALIEDSGGQVRAGADVERVIVRGGRATAVRIAGGEQIEARRAVIANVTPAQLYGRLLGDGDAGGEAAAQARRFRFNARAGTQIHLALSEPPRWRDERLGRAAVVHLADDLGSVALACAEAANGLLPSAPTVVCGQPAAVDPSRVPAGAGMLWIQLQQVPYRPRGDAAGQIDVGDGTWTDELANAFADRVVAQLARHVENLPEAIAGRAILHPAELERRNPNFGRGDIYAGATELSQSYLWRPLPSYGSHATPVPGLFEIGASTYPGPGLNAASGRIVAQRLLRPPLPRRVAARVRRG